ncbi:MAG: hypothetical protein K1V76_05330 [Candidatus Amulumruptor sp.]
MKKSSLLALVGVGLLILNNLYYLVVNSLDAWQYGWYQILGYVWNIIVLAAWVLIGQFFLTLYKKSK